jgi:recombination protein RecR
MNEKNGLGGPLDQLIRQLAALPGLGPRSARRAALHLIARKDDVLLPLARTLDHTAETVKTCSVCGNIDHSDPCRICSDPARDRGTICVVATVGDLWAIERTGGYKGLYHVLGGVLSALDGVRPEDLRLDGLSVRAKNESPKEIILALSATVDGQSTAHVIMDMLGNVPVKVTRLAHGVPVGGELDYLDDGTILTAMKSRASL